MSVLCTPSRPLPPPKTTPGSVASNSSSLKQDVRRLRNRLACILAPKPPTQACPFFLRNSASNLDATAGPPPVVGRTLSTVRRPSTRNSRLRSLHPLKPSLAEAENRGEVNRAAFESAQIAPPLPPRSTFLEAVQREASQHTDHGSEHLLFLGAPSHSWIVDRGEDDDPDELLRTVLRMLAQTLRHRQIVAVNDGDGALVTTLYVRRFTFTDFDIPKWFWTTLQSCFTAHCAIELAFHRCGFAATGGGLWAALQHLAASGVRLSKLAFSHCTSLTLLDDDESVSQYAAHDGGVLRELSFRGTFVGEGGCSILARLLASHETRLDVLDLSNTKLDGDALLQLSKGLKASRTLKVLFIDGVELPHGVGSIVLDAIKKCSTLTEVHANFVDRGNTRYGTMIRTEIESRKEHTE